MKVAVFGNKFNNEAAAYVKALFDLLVEKEAVVCVDKKFKEFCNQFFAISESVVVSDRDSLIDDATSFLISVGGDGTILDTITTVRDSNVPIVGINTGRLGFLVVQVLAKPF